MRMKVRSLASLSGLRILHWWLWRRPAAVALIRPLVREPPYAMGVSLKKTKKKKKKKDWGVENSHLCLSPQIMGYQRDFTFLLLAIKKTVYCCYKIKIVNKRYS